MSDETLATLKEIVRLLQHQSQQLDHLIHRDDRIVATMASMDARREDARTEQASVRWEEREFRAQLIALAQKHNELLEQAAQSSPRT
jgi:hypothetical protein